MYGIPFAARKMPYQKLAPFHGWNLGLRAQRAQPLPSFLHRPLPSGTSQARRRRRRHQMMIFVCYKGGA
jgi:hypothetical protein